MIVARAANAADVLRTQTVLRALIVPSSWTVDGEDYEISFELRPAATARAALEALDAAGEPRTAMQTMRPSDLYTGARNMKLRDIGAPDGPDSRNVATMYGGWTAFYAEVSASIEKGSAADDVEDDDLCEIEYVRWLTTVLAQERI